MSGYLKRRHPDILVPWLEYLARSYTTKPSVTVSDTFRLGGIMIVPSTELEITAYNATRLARQRRVYITPVSCPRRHFSLSGST